MLQRCQIARTYLSVVYSTTLFSDLHYIALNEGVISEGRNGNGCGLIFKVLPQHFPVGSENNHQKNLSQDSRSPSRDLNPGPPEYETGDSHETNKTK
jgi:hypothetical protein